MKTAKLFLAGMYVHLLLSAAAPIGILYTWAGTKRGGTAPTPRCCRPSFS